ncbi:helix-turn-helix domain-containing protein [Pseudomonas sp. ITA]|uniref:helix-turn-helix domain-containing protein n=1 Tax=Pseudomonas sp. ITA TaxID=2825841 RepID=UPI002498431B|nr:helix-turn-helix domain-containing protein [Pseudomonas sp. ITA]MDI2145903.1 helix-turn-helix domain-containing protein [Pseudomonas sp. ITA]
MSHLQNAKAYEKPNSTDIVKYLCNWINKLGTPRSADEGEAIYGADNKAIVYIEDGAWQMLVGGKKTIDIVCAGGIVWLEKALLKNTAETTQYKIISPSRYYELQINPTTLSSLDPRFIDGVFDFISRHLREISNKWLIQCTNDSYEKIKSSLEWIDSQPPFIKEKFTLIFFISTTTGVSRSHALAIVKALKEGEYIEVDRGYLVRILRKLPPSY